MECWFCMELIDPNPQSARILVQLMSRFLCSAGIEQGQFLTGVVLSFRARVGCLPSVWETVVDTVLVDSEMNYLLMR
jgi:hypothetical protein